MAWNLGSSTSGGNFFSKMFGGGQGSLSPEEKLFGFGNEKSRGYENTQRDLRDEWQAKGDEIEKERGGADSTLLAQMGGNVDRTKAGLLTSKQDWDAKQAGLERDLEAAHNSSSATYTNQIQPRMKDQMEKAQINAGSAMSLKDAMDPNNKIAAGTRDLYEKQAQGEGRQGLADAGILQAMGAQSAASQLSGGVPMTGGQMAAIYGQNQAQAGSAYANTQRRTQDLRDQGLNKGFERSDIAYGQGLDAQDRYRRSVGDYEGADRRHQGDEAAYRSEYGNRADNRYNTDKGYLQDVFGLDSGNYGLQHQLATGKTSRDEARSNRYYSGGIEAEQGKINRDQATKEGKQKMLSGGIQSIAGLMGGSSGGGGNGSHGSTTYSEREQEEQPVDEGDGGYDQAYQGDSGYQPQQQPDYNNGAGGGQGFALMDQMQPSYGSQRGRPQGSPRGSRQPSRGARRRFA